MMEHVLELSRQCYGQMISWYNAADPLTQYVVLGVSFIVMFLISTVVILSRITK